jgi:PKD repeat protein
VLTGPAPFTVKFVSTSLNNPTTFEWDFDNNGTLDASTASPTFIYSTPGTYSVRLKATNGAGSNEMTKTNFITVYDASQTTGLTNLDVNLYGPTQIRPSNEFQVTLNVVNTGLLTATNVQRTFSVSDVRGQQVPVSRLPLGSIVARIQNRTVVTLPQILSMISGSSISVSFTVTAPNVAGTINMDASVFSPEIDVETGDNTTSLSVISRV